ncbi:MAG TPA: glutathione S-transferase family protein [Beijerinckiaceae bacterium]|nr:glutathione S-transferase family protein [Beijerinckiaceae bacterium]
MSLTLYIGNKAYSSWSLRPWVAMTHMGIRFDEVVIPLDLPDTREKILAASPSGRVPALRDGAILIWESLAILDYLDEFHVRGRLWPLDRAARATARSIACEMHSGFSALRTHCPHNCRRDPAKPFALPAAARSDVDRIEAIWRDTRGRFGQSGQFLFGTFSAADAMYAPVVNRFHHYGIAVADDTRAYMDSVLNLPAMQAWKKAAEAEPWVIAASEL